MKIVRLELVFFFWILHIGGVKSGRVCHSFCSRLVSVLNPFVRLNDDPKQNMFTLFHIFQPALNGEVFQIGPKCFVKFDTMLLYAHVERVKCLPYEEFFL